MLTQIHIHHLRNLESLQIKPHPRFNFIYGPNGSGKTSILEAIYLLGSGYSFRTRETLPLVQQGQTTLTVFSKTEDHHTISIQKHLNGHTLVRLDQQACRKSSELAHVLPCMVFYHDLFQIIDTGPTIRRSILDWGLFHVEPSYHEAWKSYRTILKQRNALLRQHETRRQYYLPWEQQLVSLAETIDTLRQQYYLRWAERFQQFLPQLTDIICHIRYEKGWDKKGNGTSLHTLLEEQFEQDLHRQYTYAGPHHADILFELPSLKARQHLSRGQQKIVLIALKLAQAQLLSKPCIYLMDDITIELDHLHIERLFDSLQHLPGQFFLTSVHPLPDISTQPAGQVWDLSSLAMSEA